MAIVARPKTVGNVLFDSGDTFQQYMTSNLQQVVPLMIKRKVIKKPFGKLLKKHKDPAHASAMLLSDMKHNMSPEEFTGYLEVLTELGAEEHDLLAVQTRKLMQIMKGSLEAMKPEPNSKLDIAISEFITTAFKFDPFSQTPTQIDVQRDVECQTQTVTSDQPTEEPSTKQDIIAEQSAPVRPPAGSIGDAVSHLFTSVGGVLYSPIHGVTVTISPNAIPNNIDKFFISMHFYFHGPFSLPDGVDHCSVVVWFHQSPHFEFLEDVTIKIPHAATVDDSLCVLTWGKDRQGPVYKLDTEIPADFSDSYHAEFKVRHFSPYTDGKRKRLTNPWKKTGASHMKKNMERMNSDSLERSVDEGLAVNHSDSAEAAPSSRQLHHQEAMDCDSPACASLEREGSSCLSQDREEGCGIKYSIACCMPRDRSGSQWGVTFAACYSHPTGDWVLRLLANEIFQYDADFHLQENIGVDLRDKYFKMSPESWRRNNWEIDAIKRPPLIEEGNILRIPEKFLDSESEFIDKQSRQVSYPPRVAYEVYFNGEGHPRPRLNCLIEAMGAFARDGGTPSFLLTSTTPTSKESRKILITSSYLYEDNSDIIRTLTSQADDIILDTQIPDHTKFLADISLQLPTNTQKLCEALDRPNDQHHDNFTILGNWVSDQHCAANLRRLEHILRAVGVTGIALHEEEDFKSTSKVLLDTQLNQHSVLEVFREGLSGTSSKVKLKLPEKLQCCWKDIGRLLGIPDTEIISIERELRLDLYEQSYQMLYRWQRREGKGAKFGALFRAVHRMYHHRPLLVNDAYKYCVHYVQHHLPLNTRTSLS